MKIINVIPKQNWILQIITYNGQTLDMDIKPYLNDEAIIKTKRYL